jgi:hypothetical protein
MSDAATGVSGATMRAEDAAASDQT